MDIIRGGGGALSGDKRLPMGFYVPPLSPNDDGNSDFAVSTQAMISLHIPNSPSRGVSQGHYGRQARSWDPTTIFRLTIEKTKRFVIFGRPKGEGHPF